MTNRPDYNKLIPDTVRALLALGKSFANSTVGPTILNLVKIRASQMNGCLFCLDMHSKEAKLHGERELRLYHLPVWHESPLFSDKEKSALAWTELLTRPPKHGVTDEDYAKIAAHFSEKEIADLTAAICSINAWNRIGIAFTPAPGALDAVMGLDKTGLA